MNINNPKYLFDQGHEFETKGELDNAHKCFSKSRDAFYFEAYEKEDLELYKRALIAENNRRRVYGILIKSKMDVLMKRLFDVINPAFQKDSVKTLTIIEEFAHRISIKQNLRKSYFSLFPLKDVGTDLRIYFNDLYNLKPEQFIDKYSGKFVSFTNKYREFLKEYDQKMRSEPILSYIEMNDGIEKGIDIYQGLYEVEFRHLLEILFRLENLTKTGILFPIEDFNRKEIGELLSLTRHIPIYDSLANIFTWGALLRHSTSHKNYNIMKNSKNLILLKLDPEMKSQKILNYLQFWEEFYDVLFKISVLVSNVLDFHSHYKTHDQIRTLAHTYNIKVISILMNAIADNLNIIRIFDKNLS